MAFCLTYFFILSYIFLFTFNCSEIIITECGKSSISNEHVKRERTNARMHECTNAPKMDRETRLRAFIFPIISCRLHIYVYIYIRLLTHTSTDLLSGRKKTVTIIYQKQQMETYEMNFENRIVFARMFII